jgi:hypothetical protein
VEIKTLVTNQKWKYTIATLQEKVNAHLAKMGLVW